MQREDSRLAIVVACAVVSAAVWWWIKGDTINSDEAVIGLMALKISRGIDFPFFFWKADYCGPLASYLAAPLHWFFQPSGRLLHFVLIPLHAFYVAGVYRTARLWLTRDSALVAALLAALPFSLFTYSPLGGYTESFVLLPWIVVAFWGGNASRSPRYFIGGLLNGFALWVFPLSIPMTLVSFVFLYRDENRLKFRNGLKGFALSLVPLIAFNVEYPAASLLRLLSRPIQLNRQGALESLQTNGIGGTAVVALRHWLEASLSSLWALPQSLLSLMGLTTSTSIWIPLAGAVALLGLVFIFFSRREATASTVIPQLLAALAVAQMVYFVVFGMQRDRYLIPILMVVPFGLAALYSKLLGSRGTPLRAAVVGVLLLLNGLSNYTHHEDYRNGYPDLARQLEQSGVTRGYTDYFTAYPLIYLTNERLIFSPAFNTPEADRYKPYTELVMQSGDQALVVDNDPELVSHFRSRLNELGVKSTEQVWQSHVVFRHLSPGLRTGAN